MVVETLRVGSLNEKRPFSGIQLEVAKFHGRLEFVMIDDR